MILRVVGGLLALAGFVLAFEPRLLMDLPVVDDRFEAVEQHVRWGLLSGVGLLLVFRTRLKPWGETLAHAALWIVLAYLIARFMGIAIEGGSDRQWMWVVVEAALLVPLGGFLVWRERREAARLSGPRGDESSTSSDRPRS